MTSREKPLWLRRLALYWASLRLLRDPERLDEVIAIVSALDDGENDADEVARARSHARGASALESRYRLERIDLDRLRALPDGTFGRAFAALCDQRGLDPADLPRQAAGTDAEYITAHLYETHDLWHVATGFDTDIAGELGLQAFYISQNGGRLQPILITGGLLHALLWDEEDWAARLDAVVRGYQLGQRVQPLFGVRWDELWDTPLDEVRRSLGVPS